MKSLATFDPDAQRPARRSAKHGEAALVASGQTALETIRVAAQVAMMNPRSELDCRSDLLDSCRRPSFADNTEYEFPRGGKTIRGPNVQLAREAARCWHNVQYGFRIVSVDAQEVQIQGFAWDLQNNLRVELEDRFRRLHQRVNKETGETEWTEPDERDFREVVNRRGAILVRNCILQVLPPDLIDEAIATARKTMKGHMDEALGKDRKTVLKELCDAFRDFGVAPSMLEAKLGHSLDLITGTELAGLRVIWHSMKDGASTREEHFDTSVVETKTRTKKGRGAKAETLDDLVPPEGSVAEALKDVLPKPPPEPDEPVVEADEDDPFAGWEERHGGKA